MLFGYGMWNKIAARLNIDLPSNSLMNLQKYNQVNKYLSKDIISKDNTFFFLRFSNGDQKLQDELLNDGYNLFPNPEFSKFIRNREDYLSEIDSFIKYPLKRVYLPNLTSDIIKTIKDNFGEDDVVLKVGNLHASEGKWLVSKKRQLPHLKYDMRKQPITIEEFIPNARSIRIGIIGDANSYDNYFITEHINSKTWLKNNAPEEENTYSYKERNDLCISNIDDLIAKTKEIALRYEANLIGVDWVIGEKKQDYSS